MNKERFEELRVPGAIHWDDACVIRDAVIEHLPGTIVELGCFMGLSTLVILDAIEENEKRGFPCKFWSVDIKAPGEIFNIKDHKEARRSELVPEDAPVTLITRDAYDYLHFQQEGSIDMIFEDTNHQIEYTANLIPQILRVLHPNRGVALFHDLNLYSMKEAFKKAKMDKIVKLFPPSWMGMLKKEKGELV